VSDVAQIVVMGSWHQVTFTYGGNGEGWEGDINFRGMFKTGEMLV